MLNQSMTTAPSSASAGMADEAGMEVTTHPRKSYRRKYRKIMVKFEDRMRESTSLFKDEQRIFDISQRLAEQADQILEMLLELNQTPQIPKRMRYDLQPALTLDRLIPSTSANPDLYQDEETAHEALRVTRDRIQRGEVMPPEYEELQRDLLKTQQFAPAKSYAVLARTATMTPVTHVSSGDPASPPGTGSMTIRQEEQYLQSLDAFIAGKNSNPRAHAANNLGSRNAERTTDREREMQLRNPVSVYNWLRRHQPQVFLQDHEASGDKSNKLPGARSSKRNATGKEPKPENDLYDDDGIAVDHGASKGKRKRDDDGAFRPKGGKAAHPAKRRKEEGTSSSKKKRSSLDARTS